MIRRRFRRIALVALAAASPCLLKAADEPDSQKRFHDQSETILVQIPVWVTDKGGQPVRGLAAPDFEIEDEGVRQAIEAVDVVDLRTRQAVTGESAGTLDPAARRNFLLLFDLSYATPRDILKSRDAAAAFVSQGMEPDDRAAVATISVERGARLLVTFTSDRRQLVAAIRDLGLTSTVPPAGDPLALAFALPGDPNTVKLFVGDSGTPRSAAEIASATKVLSMTARKSGDEFASAQVNRQLLGMGALAEALDLVPGRKIVVYFSEGFDARLLVGNIHQDTQEKNAENDAMATGQYWQIDVDKRYANTPLQKQLADTMVIFRRSDCVIYPIDIAGLKADGGDASVGPPRHGEDALFTIARSTGGDVIANANDLSESLRRIADRTSFTYVLSFRPSRRISEGAFHKLKVRCRAKGSHVSARMGYFEKKGFSRMGPLERSLSAAQLVSADRVGGFRMDVLALPIRDEPLGRVPVVIEIPEVELSQGTAGQMHVGIYVYAVNDKLEVEDYFYRQIARTRGAAEAPGQSFRYYGTLRLLPGHYKIRALARDEDSGRFGYRAVSLDMAAAGTAGAALLPPLFVGSADSGANFRAHADDAAGAAEPFAVGGNLFIPMLRPEIRADQPSRVCLLVYDSGRSTSDPDLGFEVNVLDAQHHPFSAGQFRLIGRTSPDKNGLVKLLAEFTPGKLAPGDYELSVRIKRNEPEAASRETRAPFRIR